MLPTQTHYQGQMILGQISLVFISLGSLGSRI